MQCPKCGDAMVVVEHAGIKVDRCAACGGLWFDGAEHLELKKAGGAAALDAASGSARGAAEPSARPGCPACGEAMATRYDAYQHHIHYEVCRNGHGAYFDAGEFRDFVTDDWSDFFKGLFTHFPRN